MILYVIESLLIILFVCRQGKVTKISFFLFKKSAAFFHFLKNTAPSYPLFGFVWCFYCQRVIIYNPIIRVVQFQRDFFCFCGNFRRKMISSIFFRENGQFICFFLNRFLHLHENTIHLPFSFFWLDAVNDFQFFDSVLISRLRLNLFQCHRTIGKIYGLCQFLAGFWHRDFYCSSFITKIFSTIIAIPIFSIFFIFTSTIDSLSML